MGYSNCGPLEFRGGLGTSFAAPQVSAAAALLLGVDPRLKPDQVEWLLERSATDADPASGCAACPVGRDSLTGWGDLNVAAALDLLGNEHNLPAPDAYEPNDNANTIGASAHPLGKLRSIVATLDFWDDPIDVYSIKLTAGSKVFARLGTGADAGTTLVLWKPGTTDVTAAPRTRCSATALLPPRSLRGSRGSATRCEATGTYYVEVKIGAPNHAPDLYHLSVAVTP